jgi:uncharacterized protein (DUF2384 family)
MSSSTPAYEEQREKKSEKMRAYNRRYYAKMKAAREKAKESAPIISLLNGAGDVFAYSKKEVEEFIFEMDAEALRMLAEPRPTQWTSSGGSAAETDHIAEERDPFKRILRIAKVIS